MATPKTTSQISFDAWTTIQMRLTGAADFSDTAPLDDVSGVGTGPFLVFDRGIWKYPQQAVGGRIVIPATLSRPLRLVNMMANFGASVPWTLSVAHSVANLSNEPYPAADAALYETGSVQVHSATSRYVADNLDAADAGIAVLIWPGQKLVLTTTGANNPVVRFSFALATEPC